MAQSTISVRMDEQLKQDFDQICQDLGLTMSTAITILAKKMIRESRLPFEVSIADPRTLAAMDDVMAGRNLHGPFSTVDQLMEDLDSDD